MGLGTRYQTLKEVGDQIWTHSITLVLKRRAILNPGWNPETCDSFRALEFLKYLKNTFDFVVRPYRLYPVFRIHIFLGHLDPLVRRMDQDPPAKIVRKTLTPTVL
jgi:hypothetical protein